MRGAALIGIGCALVGALGGVVWGLLAPGRTQVVGDGGTLLTVDLTGNHVFDAVAIFVWISVAVGVIAGAAAWTWRSMRGPLTVVAVVLGSLLGAWFAAGLGALIARSRYTMPDAAALASMVGKVVVQPPTITLWVALVAQALAACFVYLVATLLAPDADLGARPRVPSAARPQGTSRPQTPTDPHAPGTA